LASKTSLTRGGDARPRGTNLRSDLLARGPDALARDFALDRVYRVEHRLAAQDGVTPVRGFRIAAILSPMRRFKIVVEHHEDGYVAYPVGLHGVVVGEGNSLDEALADVRSAIQFHIETFGGEAAEDEPLDVVLADLAVPA
jgi:predicted RNase H-like HicB family nuclease